MWRAKSTAALKKDGITHVLPVGINLPQYSPDQFVYYPNKIAIEDDETEDLLSHFDSCYEFIDGALQKGRVYVHCAAGTSLFCPNNFLRTRMINDVNLGISRSSTVVIAYIMKKQGLNTQDALDLVRSKRDQVWPNSGFVKQLELYEEWQCNIDVSTDAYKEYVVAMKAEQEKRPTRRNIKDLFD